MSSRQPILGTLYSVSNAADSMAVLELRNIAVYAGNHGISISQGMRSVLVHGAQVIPVVNEKYILMTPIHDNRMLTCVLNYIEMNLL